MSEVFSLEMYSPFYLFLVFKVVRQLRVSFSPSFRDTSLIPMEAIHPVSPAAVCAHLLLMGFYSFALGINTRPSPSQCTQVYRSNPHNNPNTFRLVRQALSYFSALVILSFPFPNHYDCSAR